MESIPSQYKKEAELLIYEIGQIANKLFPFITELGDNIEIECDKCMIIIKKSKSD